MTRFVTRERERESTLSSVQLFGDSSIVAFNPWLRFTQRIFLHGTGEEKKEKEGKEEEVGLLGNEERESFSFAFRSCCSFFRLFRPNGQTSFNPPRIFLLLPFDFSSLLPRVSTSSSN